LSGGKGADDTYMESTLERGGRKKKKAGGGGGIIKTNRGILAFVTKAYWMDEREEKREKNRQTGGGVSWFVHQGREGRIAGTRMLGNFIGKKRSFKVGEKGGEELRPTERN